MLGGMLPMQDFRGEVQSIGPYNGPSVRIHTHLGKELGGVQWLRHGPAGFAGPVGNIANDTIIEEKNASHGAAGWRHRPLRGSGNVRS